MNNNFPNFLDIHNIDKIHLLINVQRYGNLLIRFRISNQNLNLNSRFPYQLAPNVGPTKFQTKTEIEIRLLKIKIWQDFYVYIALNYCFGREIVILGDKQYKFNCVQCVFVCVFHGAKSSFGIILIPLNSNRTQIEQHKN